MAIHGTTEMDWIKHFPILIVKNEKDLIWTKKDIECQDLELTVTYSLKVSKPGKNSNKIQYFRMTHAPVPCLKEGDLEQWTEQRQGNDFQKMKH